MDFNVFVIVNSCIYGVCVCVCVCGASLTQANICI